MDLLSFTWTLMDLHVFRRIYMDFIGFICIYIDIAGSTSSITWLLVAFCGACAHTNCLLGHTHAPSLPDRIMVVCRNAFPRAT